MLSVLLLSSDYLCLNFLPFSFFLVGSVFLDNFAVSSWLSWADPSTLRAAWLRAFFLAFSFFLSFLVHNYKLSSFFFKNLKFDFQFPRYMSGDTLALSSVQRRIPPWSLPLWRRHLIAKKILFYPRAKNIPISSRLRTRTRAHYTRYQALWVLSDVIVTIRLSDWSICTTWPLYSILIGPRYTGSILLLLSGVNLHIMQSK